MSFAAALLPEFEHEAATTRTLLEVAPPAQYAWGLCPWSHEIKYNKNCQNIRHTHPDPSLTAVG